MHPRTLTGAAAAAALACTLPTTHAQDPHPLIGTWSGTWKSGTTVELTVDSVSNETATGISCNAFAHGGFWFYDIGTDVIDATIDRRGRLRYEARQTRHEYRPHRRDADRMQLRQRRKGKTHRLDMRRTDADASICRSRVRTIDEGMKPPAVPTGESPLIGIWRGRWGETDAVTEIGIWRLADQTVHATYCHQSGPSYWVADLKPNGTMNSRVTPEGDLRFKEAGKRKTEWIMTPHFGGLSMQYIRDGDRSTVRLARTNEPVCLSRVAPHPASADRR